MLTAALLCCILAQAPEALDEPRISAQQVEEARRTLMEAEIHRVSAAVDSQDGRSLPPGWWLSDERMLVSGQELVRLQNREAELQAEVLKLQAANQGRVHSNVIGLALGIFLGFASAVGVYTLVTR